MIKNIILGVTNKNKQHRPKTNNKVNFIWSNRVTQCKKCEFMKDSFAFKRVSEKIYPEIQGKACAKCGCCLSYKIRSDSKCPINKW